MLTLTAKKMHTKTAVRCHIHLLNWQKKKKKRHRLTGCSGCATGISSLQHRVSELVPRVERAVCAGRSSGGMTCLHDTSWGAVGLSKQGPGNEVRVEPREYHSFRNGQMKRVPKEDLRRTDGQRERRRAGRVCDKSPMMTTNRNPENRFLDCGQFIFHV